MTKFMRYFFIAITTIPGFISCKKSEADLPHIPVAATYVQFTATGISLTGNQLYALVSINKASGEEVVANKKVTIDNIQGVYKTDKIQLEKAGYKLTKFIVVNASDTAVYATPRINTAKASQINHPLDKAFTVSQKPINTMDVEVLKITNTDAPASFGYSDNDFGFVNFIKINVSLMINIGSVVYDNLSGKLLVKAMNAQGAPWVREIDLQNGVTQVRVPDNFSSYHFEAKRWNLTATKTILRADVVPAMHINLETARQPKRLVQETSSVETAGSFIPESRNEYLYNGNGRLSEIKYYQKSTQVSGLPLTYIYRFTYSNTVLDSINRYAADQSNTGFTAFFYNAGKISNMHNKSYDQETGAAVQYTTTGEGYEINVDYLYHNGNSLVYKKHYVNGNKTSDQATSSNNGSESGIYAYDDNINPKHQLGYPDLYFTNSSKNNLVNEQKSYGGAIPQAIRYKFEYTYDADGYPVELYISYKGFTSQQHLYRIKHTYTYQ